MSVWFCPRCTRPGVQADGYAYCVRCRNQRQNEARNANASVFKCPQCTHEREKHPNYKLCIVCGAERLERKENIRSGNLKSREEQNWMKGFDQLSQDYLMRRLV